MRLADQIDNLIQRIGYDPVIDRTAVCRELTRLRNNIDIIDKNVRAWEILTNDLIDRYTALLEEHTNTRLNFKQTFHEFQMSYLDKIKPLFTEDTE